MTKLYLIWYASASIAAIWGPLPYDMDECQKRASSFIEELKDSGKKLGHDVDDWSLSCENRAKKPELGEAQDKTSP